VPLQTLNIRFEDGRERNFRHRGTAADLGVISQIFEARDYSLRPLQRGAELQGLYDRIAAAGRVPLVLDAGANIGASVLYFAHAFPCAHIAALEPARNNFELLRANAAGLDVDARCAAIGARIAAVAADPSIAIDALQAVEAGDRTQIVAGDRLVMFVVDAQAGIVEVLAAQASLHGAQHVWR